MNTSLQKIVYEVQFMSGEETVTLTKTLRPKLLEVSRLRRRVKRDLLIKVEDEQRIARAGAMMTSRSMETTRTIDEEEGDEESTSSLSSDEESVN